VGFLLGPRGPWVGRAYARACPRAPKTGPNKTTTHEPQGRPANFFFQNFYLFSVSKRMPFGPGYWISPSAPGGVVFVPASKKFERGSNLFATKECLVAQYLAVIERPNSLFFFSSFHSGIGQCTYAR
jgi:hypothetical protein